MKLLKPLRTALAFSGASIVVFSGPTRADIPLTRGRVLSSSNQVELLNPTETTARPATTDACFCTGDRLTTQAAAQADVLFNDGSLMRLGEQSQVSFWPQSRELRLLQGTSLLFVPPTLGRVLVHTPNALTGVQENAAVIRYIPASGLTLVMALANSESGTVSITTRMQPPQEFTLEAGQMALIQGSDIQVVEFELQEFYATSRLAAGFHPGAASFSAGQTASIAPLQLALLEAINVQPPFKGSSPVLDPAVISIHDNPPDLFEAEAELASPGESSFLLEEFGRYEDAPPGVVSPLPEMSPEPLPEASEPIVEETGTINAEAPENGLPISEP